jgi:hypothetical protein
MHGEIKMHSSVALLEDVPAKHFLTGQPLSLRRGQVGTIVMTYDGTAFEVEFFRARWPSLCHFANQSRKTHSAPRGARTRRSMKQTEPEGPEQEERREQSRC